MKKLLLITLLSIGLLSCGDSHVDYPLKVNSIKINDNPSHKSKYEVIVLDECSLGDVKIYTDSLFQVGDTIR